MTLAEWAKDWPYLVRRFRPTDASTGLYSGPETEAMVTPSCVNDRRYSDAFHLSDYLVSSVSGGSIWFLPRRQA